MVTATKAAEHHRTNSQLIVNRCPVRPIGTRGLFCSKSCHDAQHGGESGAM